MNGRFHRYLTCGEGVCAACRDHWSFVSLADIENLGEREKGGEVGFSAKCDIIYN